MRFRHRSLETPDTVCREVQGSPRCYPRIKLSNRTCRRISRIGERREALFVTITVHIVKISPIHKDFASHLDKRRISKPSCAIELQGDGLNGTDVDGDIFARVTVTAGRTRS